MALLYETPFFFLLIVFILFTSCHSFKTNSLFDDILISFSSFFYFILYVSNLIKASEQKSIS